MPKLRCIAIDDEPFALEILADDIRKVSFLELVGQFASPLDALSLLQQEPIDLLFLDIQMPTLTGVQFLRTLVGGSIKTSARQYPPMVIFTTAYEQYALEGYELSVVDYLLKPIPFERFLKAVNKAYDLFALRQSSADQSKVASPVQETTGADATLANLSERPVDFFFIFSEYREIKIFHSEVLYIEGLKDYVKIYTVQQPAPYLSRLTLKAIEAKLPADGFCRVHKSFIVSLAKISSFQRTRVFIGKQEIPVGSNYVEEFEQKYGAE
ncbi:LytR/AlgR family response regulator transcription factor [Spirosoma soli]|uniref:LytR/AlgR family response regulator transcription factor n=1 Tax=Spirosoma soli TaxID=1770529 RepID=A0ABW5LY11_9BACT